MHSNLLNIVLYVSMNKTAGGHTLTKWLKLASQEGVTDSILSGNLQSVWTERGFSPVFTYGQTTYIKLIAHLKLKSICLAVL